MVIKKELTLYDRDEKGELLPKEVKMEVDEEDEAQLEFLDETLIIVPIPRGKINRLFVSAVSDKEKDLDGEIIREHCIEPKYDDKELKHLKPALATIIVNTIFRESGIGRNKNKKKAVKKAEDDFAKN